MKRLLAVSLGALLLYGCASESRDEAEFAVAEDAEMSLVGSAAPQAVAPAPPPPGQPQAPVQADSSPPSMLIRTGSATLEVASIGPGVEAVKALATRLGGYVTSVTVHSGRDQLRRAELVVRVPAPRFADALAGLGPVGEVESVSESAQDVGEEYADIQAQVRNRARLEARLLELLATRTGRLEDVLAVERELARVREAIERQEGRLRYLRHQVAMSTLTVSLHEREPLFSTYRGENVLLGAARDAWRNFVGVIVWLIGAIGVIVPLGLLGWLVWLLARRARRRRDRTRTRAAAGPGGTVS